MEYKKLYMGLDVSTSVVGYGIVDVDLNLHHAGYVSLSKIDGLSNKGIRLQEELSKFKDIIYEVAIEAPLLMFKKGKSKASTISVLSQINGMSQLISHNMCGIPPVMYNVGTARSLAFKNMKFPVGSDRKKIVRARVEREYDSIDWLYCPRAVDEFGDPKLKKEMFDLADAIVVARAHVISINKG